MKKVIQRLFSFVAIAAVLCGSFTLAAPASPVAAAASSVTIAGDLQQAMGCAGTWDAACADSHLAYDSNDDVWQKAWTIPYGTTGHWEYKATINDSWDENYGLHAAPGGANIPLNLTADTSVKFYYDEKTHWVTDNIGSIIATVPGNYQTKLGCAGDWDAGCLRSWLEDPDGDGIYSFQTTSIPAGSYEAKVAINEDWGLNYGANGDPNGANIPFTVNQDGSTVTFSWDSTSHLLTINVKGIGPDIDNDIWWDGLRHDSRDTLYRTPGGAVPAGTPVTIRFRTYHNDVTAVTMRVYDLNSGSQSLVDMKLAAADESCYQDLPFSCDYWQATLPNSSPNNLWYRFVITDGTKTVYYGDDTPALDGGLGATTNDPVDQSYALTVYDPAFSTPNWSKSAIIYQIFPDRFRNGNSANDPQTGMVRYDDPAIKLSWGTLPEGYCRDYTDASCPWRFDPNPPSGPEAPRGRDYFGGDLKGVTQKLAYLKTLGVSEIYFNPVFDARSNHGYDTVDYTKINPNLGTLKEFTDLVNSAKKLGIKVVLDGVFNHMSSDSPAFDRYLHYSEVGACESGTSSWRSWFTFKPPAAGEPSPCAPSTPGGNDTYYDGWFGFDSIPVLTKSNPDVQSYFLTGNNNISTLWLNRGAAGWRLDVMGDSSFPAGYWNTFRTEVKTANPNAVIYGELWQKDSTLLRFLRGDLADSAMNYRLRDAVISLLASQNFDSKGFADSGHPIAPSVFASRMQSMREDYPDAAYYTTMNLLDSHDTERVLWTLTPGAANRAEKEQNAANLAVGKQKVQLASTIQFTLPGAPMVYYGDEVGMTGATDPDDRRTFPWPDTGGKMDTAMLAHYQKLALMRNTTPALVSGDFRVLLADDAASTLAYGRKLGTSAALILLNTGSAAQTVTVPLAGYIPDGVKFKKLYAVANPANLALTSAGGAIQATLNPMSALVLGTVGKVDLTPTTAPKNLKVTAEGSTEVSLAWNAVSGAVGYNLYRSPVSGGGYVKVNGAPLTGTTYTDTGLKNARLYYYVVRALDAKGNESADSNEASALPHLVIGWANLQWPPTMTHTISATTYTDTAYGQVWIDGATSNPGLTPTLRAQLGFGPEGSNPASDPSWVWTEASFNVDAGSNDEFKAAMLPEVTGAFDYLYRYSTTNGRDWVYADQNGLIPAGALPTNPGKLTVNSSGDTTAPDVPTGLIVTAYSSASIDLAWNANAADPTLYGYEVLRADDSGGPYTKIAFVTASNYSDTSVTSGATYYYVVRALDTSFNRSGNSAEVSATAALRIVTVVFNVTVPDTTDATGRSVYIAGTLDLLNGGMPQWDPTKVVLTRVDATHWTITLTGYETVQIQYKYALGDWNYVEKDNACGEIGNRLLTLSYGTNGTQTVNDTVQNWRNVSPCGN